MIDFHCHLDLFPEPFAIAEKCRAHNLYVLSVTTTPSAWPRSRELSHGRDRIRVALGLHPQIAHERENELELFDRFLPQTKYVGEVGLDGGPELANYQKHQKRVFNHILKACGRAGGKIISVHSRRAATPVLDAIASNPSAGQCILHWFSGSMSELKRAVSMDLWFSVGPAMLASKKGRQLLAEIPRHRVLTETDSPFAQSGATALMPWDVEEAQDEIAKIWQVSSEEASSILLSNFRELVAPVR